MFFYALKPYLPLCLCVCLGDGLVKVNYHFLYKFLEFHIAGTVSE